MQPLRILVIATKSPWPPVDGGRLVLLTTIEGLAAAGHTVELVAPAPGGDDERQRAADALGNICRPRLVDAAPRPILAAAARALVSGTPVSVARHALPAVRRAVAAAVDRGNLDVIHAEQLHALPQAAPAAAAGLPVVHRAHNVESALWAFAAQHRGPLTRAATACEARRMTAWEAEALETSTATVTLSEADRRSLSELVPGASIHAVAAPFAAELPAGHGGLDGEPVVTTIASATWAPSRDAVARFARDAWPAVRRRLPGAVLHVFGGRPLDGLDGVVRHPPPDDSADAFPDGAVVVVPARHPTGVPMKVLEAWARGLPVIADPSTAAALGADGGGELLVTAGPEGYADAFERLCTTDGLRQQLIDGGRRALAERHDPAAVTDHLVRVYRWAMGR